LKDSGAKVYRFSIEWSRIEPKMGEFNTVALNTYADWIRKLLAENIQPVITLNHFTIPQWFLDIGGFSSTEDTVRTYFKKYVKKVIEYFDSKGIWEMNWDKERVIFVTFNEPFLYCLHAYVLGRRPPEHINLHEFHNTVKTICSLHIDTYKFLHKFFENKLSKPLVTMSTNVVVFRPEDENDPDSVNFCKELSDIYNFGIPDAVQQHYEKDTAEPVSPKLSMNLSSILPVVSTLKKWLPEHVSNWLSEKTNLETLECIDCDPKISCNKCMDIFGMNHYNVITMPKYTRLLGMKLSNPDTDEAENSLGWGINKTGMLNALRMVHKRYQIPILVTESGTCFDVNEGECARTKQLLWMLDNVATAISEGIDVFGVCVWTLVDNLEWGEKNKDGGEPCFGHYKRDYSSRDVAEVYKGIMKSLYGYSQRLRPLTVVTGTGFMQDVPELIKRFKF